MQKRTREICMLRAIGMSVAMIKRVMLFENLILGLVAVLTAFVFSHPVLKYLYEVSDMRAFGHEFRFAYTEFLVVAMGTVVICIFLSFAVMGGIYLIFVAYAKVELKKAEILPAIREE